MAAREAPADYREAWQWLCDEFYNTGANRRAIEIFQQGLGPGLDGTFARAEGRLQAETDLNDILRGMGFPQLPEVSEAVWYDLHQIENHTRQAFHARRAQERSEELSVFVRSAAAAATNGSDNRAAAAATAARELAFAHGEGVSKRTFLAAVAAVLEQQLGGYTATRWAFPKQALIERGEAFSSAAVTCLCTIFTFEGEVMGTTATAAVGGVTTAFDAEEGGADVPEMGLLLWEMRKELSDPAVRRVMRRLPPPAKSRGGGEGGAVDVGIGAARHGGAERSDIWGEGDGVWGRVAGACPLL
mmetsp:Transcript_19720/g.66762  ORF Transcript_19720/g.66762 Transcript_19720/m.66762 type:complete len:301 (-) Transcript_19720:84-986(-)